MYIQLSRLDHPEQFTLLVGKMGRLGPISRDRISDHCKVGTTVKSNIEFLFASYDTMTRLDWGTQLKVVKSLFWCLLILLIVGIPCGNSRYYPLPGPSAIASSADSIPRPWTIDINRRCSTSSVGYREQNLIPIPRVGFNGYSFLPSSPSGFLGITWALSRKYPYHSLKEFAGRLCSSARIMR